MRLHAAGAQIAVSPNIEANVAALERAIAYAHQSGADILLTPEGSLSGYTPDFDAEEVRQALQIVTRQARDAGLALALGTCFVEPDHGKCYNELRFYGKDGVFLGMHTKTLRCGTLTEPSIGEINHYGTRPLRTFEVNGIHVGGLICNDLWANPGCTPVPDPHLSQQLAGMGTKVVFHAANGGRDGSEWSRINWNFHESNLQMRAHAGRLWIVTVDNCAPIDLPCSAPGGVVAPNGRWMVRTEARGEQFFNYVIDFA